VNKPRNETNGTGVNNGVIKPIKNMRITNGQGYMGGKMNGIEEKRMRYDFAKQNEIADKLHEDLLKYIKIRETFKKDNRK